MGTLLVIDDSPAVREELVGILRTDGAFTVFLEASDGIQGMKRLSEPGAGVDVVACDLNMPVMDGFQFLRLVRANPAFMNIPIVMVTAESDVEDVVKAFDLGANDFISKPFVPSILRARLKNMLHIKHLQDLLKAQKDMMAEVATRDALTGLANVRSFRQSLEDEINRTARYRKPMSLLLGDLDHFKAINDTHGHPRGDAVLKETGKVFLGVTRKVDIVARYGGEEFVVIMPHTDLEGAARAGERLRTAIEGHRFEGLEAGSLTISIGVATYGGEEGVDADALVKAADEALYRAKVSGRNRVEMAPPRV